MTQIWFKGKLQTEIDLTINLLKNQGKLMQNEMEMNCGGFAWERAGKSERERKAGGRDEITA
ncbi:MAG: hypothetical protein Q4C60_00495 [Eubacteriales bacterium]|nr:hypothetical protein [Eubacteriales bacterium]